MCVCVTNVYVYASDSVESQIVYTLHFPSSLPLKKRSFILIALRLHFVLRKGILKKKISEKKKCKSLHIIFADRRDFNVVAQTFHLELQQLLGMNGKE